MRHAAAPAPIYLGTRRNTSAPGPTRRPTLRASAAVESRFQPAAVAQSQPKSLAGEEKGFG